MIKGYGRRAGLAVASLLALALAAGPALAAKACKDCHTDLAKVLPKSHPKVKNATLAGCLSCHEPDTEGKPEKNAYPVAMHRAHMSGKGALACTECHVVKESGKLGAAGGKIVLIADQESFDAAAGLMKQPDAARWTAGLHATSGHSCASCHGAGLPKAGAEVANDRCLTCHGPLDKLVEKTKPAQFADRNPHHSHLGDIACTTCHRGHEASAVYCLDCHPKFEMKISGAAPS